MGLAYDQATAKSLRELSVRGVLARQLKGRRYDQAVGDESAPVLSNGSRRWAVIITSCSHFASVVADEIR